eukprot:3897497-Heterocapsa_arctica.AAC.1
MQRVSWCAVSQALTVSLSLPVGNSSSLYVRRTSPLASGVHFLPALRLGMPLLLCPAFSSLVGCALRLGLRCPGCDAKGLV